MPRLTLLTMVGICSRKLAPPSPGWLLRVNAGLAHVIAGLATLARPAATPQYRGFVSRSRVARFPDFRRVEGVRVPSSPDWGWLRVAAQAAPYSTLPKACGILIISVVVGGFIRLLMEWQLRRTLKEIFERAPGGSVVVIHKRGLGGSMWVQVGSGAAPTGWPVRTEIR
jgi:hypothetical protein